MKNLYREVSGYASESEAKIGCAEYEQKFLEAVNNDLDTPKALTVVWGLVDSNYPSSEKLKTLLKFDEVLGLDLAKIAKDSSKIPEVVKKLLKKREIARKKDDFKDADDIRTELKEKGYEVIDSKEGQKLKRNQS